MVVALRSRCRDLRAFFSRIVLCCASTSPQDAFGNASWVVRLWRDIHYWCKDPKLYASGMRGCVVWAARRQRRLCAGDSDAAITAERAASRGELSLRYRAFVLQFLVPFVAGSLLFVIRGYLRSSAADSSHCLKRLRYSVASTNPSTMCLESAGFASS